MNEDIKQQLPTTKGMEYEPMLCAVCFNDNAREVLPLLKHMLNSGTYLAYKTTWNTIGSTVVYGNVLGTLYNLWKQHCDINNLPTEYWITPQESWLSSLITSIENSA